MSSLVSNTKTQSLAVRGHLSRRLIKAAVVVVIVVIGAAQLIRPERTNPATDESQTLRAQLGTASGIVSVIDRACSDCHSNATTWPWYTRIAPLSWLMAYGVSTGRKAVNFSEWAAYPAVTQRALLAASCHDVSIGKMPGSPYTFFHPEARLSATDVETICAATR